MDERNLPSYEDTLFVACPHALSLKAHHPLGPLARRWSRKIRIPALPFTLANRETCPISYSIALDPLEREQDGASAAGDLFASHGPATISAGGGPLIVEANPGKPIKFHLSAEGALPPGRYVSRLHVHCADRHHLIPITIRISSHWFWSLIFLLFGLLFLGVAGFPAGASDITARKEEAQAMRRSLYEILERLPAAGTGKTVAAEADERLTDALEYLGMPRPWSISDWRLHRVDEDLAKARRQLYGLREEAERTEVGEAEVTSMVKEWEELKNRMAAVEGHFKNPGQGLPAAYDAFLRVQYQAAMSPALSAVRGQLEPYVERTRLTFASNERRRAQIRARQVRHWSHNGASLLDRRVSLMIGWRHLCEEMAVRQAALEAAVQYPETPADLRWGLREKLKDIRWAFERGPATLASFQKLYVRLQEMETTILKLHSKSVVDEEALRSYGSRLESKLRGELRNSGNLLSLLQPHPSLAGLEEELNHLRLELDRLPEGEGIDRLLDVDRRLLETGSRMMTVLITAREVSPEAMTTAVELSAVPEAVALARRLLTEPSPLRVEPQGPAGDRYVGREITLKVQDLDPAWGPEVKVAVDFGDGSPLVVKSVEEIRRGADVTHRYMRPQRMTVQIAAAERFTPGSVKPVGELLGHGETALDMGPSPVPTKRELAGQLFNLRFFIALGISLLLQGWRFYSERSRRPFGAMGRDYVETFALGLAMDAGIRMIAEILARNGFYV